MLYKTFILAAVLASGLIAQPFPHTKTFTIAENASLSDVVEVREGTHPQGACTPSAIVMDSAWTTANITVQVSTDGITFQDLYDELGNEVIIVAAASRTIKLDASSFWGAGLQFKFRSGTTGTPVTQVALRTLKLVCR